MYSDSPYEAGYRRGRLDAQNASFVDWSPEDDGFTAKELYERIYGEPDMHAAFMAGKHASEYVDLEGAVGYILRKLGFDPANQHFLKTPERVTKVLRSFHQPVDLEDVLSDGFADDDEPGVEEEHHHQKVLVVQTNIPFMGLCAHHLLPFVGQAAVGYLPDKRVVGLSKLTRLVYAAGHISPTTQEHITDLVADALFRSARIAPKGVAVLATATHGCMAVRGVESPDTKTITSAIRGVIADIPALEAKFMDLAKGGLGL